MDYGGMLGDSLTYTRDVLWGKWARWILLILSTIIFPLLLGYIMEIYRGKRDPELEGWVKLFIDGLKYILASLIYALPVILIMLVFGGIAVLSVIGSAAAGGDPNIFAESPELLAPLLLAFGTGIILAVIVGLLITLIATMALVRMARTDRFGEAFNFRAILETIRGIGWGSYILALIVLWLVSLLFGIVLSAIMAIPFIGWILWLFLIPAVNIFTARYITLIYESGAQTISPA